MELVRRLTTTKEKKPLFSMSTPLPPPPEGMVTSAVLAPERSELEGGLWTTQKYGELKEGDGQKAPAYVTGRVEMRQLRGLFKLSFSELKVVHRRHVEESDSSDDDDAFEAFGSPKKVKKKQHLNLRIYLSKKKTKKRMADIEETGSLVKHDLEEGSYVCVGDATGDFDLSLKDVKDPMTYKGLVIAKGHMEWPLSEEPTVFGYVRFIDDRPDLPSTETALGMLANKDIMERMNAASTRGQLKSVKFYGRQARKAWEELGKVEEAQIVFTEFKRALDLLDITVLEPRAMRLFSNCDLDGSGEVGITEMEIGLMMNDAAKDYGMSPLNAFYMFDLDGTGEISFDEFKQVLHALGAYPVGKANKKKDLDETQDAARQAREMFDKADRDKSGVMEFSEFKHVWVRCVDAAYELTKRGDVPMKGGTFASAVAKKRNEMRLLELIQDEETTELSDMNSVRDRVEQIRVRTRVRRDEKKREKDLVKAKQGLSSAKDTALRNKERRKQLQLEQKERSARRNEEKVMKNKLAQEQAASKQRTMNQMKLDRVHKEKERVMRIRTAGLDRLELSYQALREVPPELYADKEALERLSDLVAFSLSNNKLERLPPMGFLYWMTNLRSCDLSQNRLLELPDELENLGKLQVLALENNSLRSLPPQLEQCTALQQLNLAHNKLAALPPAIGALGLLEELAVHSNLLEGLPREVGSLYSLQRLDARGNRLRQLPEEFSQLASLLQLNLSSNVLKFLPEEFGDLNRLTKLDFSKNQVSALPPTLAKLASLETLMMAENELRVLGAYVGGWTRVVELDASHNAIKLIDPAIGEMGALRRLKLRSNGVAKLPAEMGLVTALQALDLGYNELTALPVELGALALLYTLELGHNRIAGRIPDQLGLLRSLTSLDLSHNGITELPETLGGLEDLVVLNLGFNSLRVVPEGLRYCTVLERLDLSSNRIDRLPTHIGRCASLRELDLTSNMIEYLPEDLTGLTAVSRIFLGKNRIAALPLGLANLTDAVQEINMERNPLADLPAKWNERYSLREQYLRPSGYTEDQALEWVRKQTYFYEAAAAEWAETGAYHYSNRSSLANFERAVRLRAGRAWHPGLAPLLRSFYFQAKRTGVPPAYHLLADDEQAERARLTAVGEARRDELVVRVREAAQHEADRVEELYHAELDKRAQRAEAALEARSERLRIKHEVSAATLADEVERRRRLQEQRAARLLSQRTHDDADELRRLRGHLRDTEGEPADGLYFPPAFP